MSKGTLVDYLISTFGSNLRESVITQQTEEKKEISKLEASLVEEYDKLAAKTLTKNAIESIKNTGKASIQQKGYRGHFGDFLTGIDCFMKIDNVLHSRCPNYEGMKLLANRGCKSSYLNGYNFDTGKKVAEFLRSQGFTVTSNDKNGTYDISL